MRQTELEIHYYYSEHVVLCSWHSHHGVIKIEGKIGPDDLKDFSDVVQVLKQKFLAQDAEETGD